MGESGGAPDHSGLSEEDQGQLLHIARTAIEKRVRGEETPDFEISSKVLQEKRGVFVTIRKEGSLRGCIGFIQGIRPLFQAVEEMAAAAAFHDPRFSPVAPEELTRLTLEISVLSPLKKVEDISEIQVGTHGIYIVLGPRSGLLLPQVATEQGWDRATFLQHTALKAGLPPEAWKDPQSEVYIFSADVFSE